VKYLALVVCALLAGACGPPASEADPTPPTAPPPLATLPPPAVDTPGVATPTPAITSTPPPPPVVPPADPTLVEPLQEVLDTWRQASGAPGAAVGLRLADGRTAVAASGTTEADGPELVEIVHRFRIGSITKTFVAVLLVQLEDEGLVDLDDPLAGYVPWAPHAEAVSLRQLLRHTSGLPDFGGLPVYRQQLLFNPAREWRARETVQLIDGLPLDFAPDSSWRYSNTNYVLAGLVAEEVAGRPLATLLRERIHQPLGLSATYLEGLEEAPPIETVGHYDIDGDGRPNSVRFVPYTALVTSGAAAGGLSSTAHDVLEFAAGLFDGRLLAGEGLEEMIAPADVSPAYGLGLSLFRREGRLFIGHAGALPGYSALLAHQPDEGVTVVALANQTGVDVQALAEQAYALVGGE
jgi:D-alanyl-D-alanine carboxypeptidase